MTRKPKSDKKAPASSAVESPSSPSRSSLLYHFCRLQLPDIVLSAETCQRHLARTFELYQAKSDGDASWDRFLDNLYPLDWFVAAGCVEGLPRAWEHLFAIRTGRTDCLLVDALRSRAGRLYPRNEERQESAVHEFWSHLFVPERAGSLPILARYDGQRPLAPWLIRVFQNWHISQLRQHTGMQALPENDLVLPLPSIAEDQWREVFTQAAHDWIAQLGDDDIVLLGLRLRYRLSQREVAQLLHIHEGTVSRRSDNLRDRGLEFLEKRLIEQGWAGDNLSEYVRTEMHSVLLDAPRLSADQLAKDLSKLQAGDSPSRDR